MKKTLAQISVPKIPRKPIALRVRVVSGLTLLTLLAGIGLFASRPAHTTGGPVPVAVTNTVQNRDLDNSTRQPFQIESIVSFTGPFMSKHLIQVPAGKRLVIESLTAQYNDSTVNSYSIFLQGDTGTEIAGLSLTPGTDPSPIKTQPVRLTAEPGEKVAVYIDSNDAQDNANVIVSASGYYVNVP